MRYASPDEVKRALKRADFPAAKDELIRAPEAAGASDNVFAALRAIPPEEYANRANDVASQLPKPAKEWLNSGPPEAERFGIDEFIRRVSERTQVPPEEARKAVGAVFSTLHLAVTGGEFKDMMSQLPGAGRKHRDRA